ncbi:hypothetical protein BDV25DRAFT_140038 [Aspergillus avenaceus]|uniref:Uncharacterized protein n=1 Tax=Aspergillus avenaceus TaxID=36643 RepID=A0A5N6TV73_ASPAV|nr:hypothetical protein BDV25DRAFT_140038 [Aspergillus avenaceus]
MATSIDLLDHLTSFDQLLPSAKSNTNLPIPEALNQTKAAYDKFLLEIYDHNMNYIDAVFELYGKDFDEAEWDSKFQEASEVYETGQTAATKELATEITRIFLAVGQDKYRYYRIGARAYSPGAGYLGVCDRNRSVVQATLMESMGKEWVPALGFRGQISKGYKYATTRVASSLV